MRRYGRNAETGGERVGVREGREEGRRGKERCHLIVIPFSENGIHLLAPFAVKEMMNSVACSLRF